MNEYRAKPFKDLERWFYNKILVFGFKVIDWSIP